MNEHRHYGRKRSGIRRELIKKIEDWLKSIDNEAVRKAAESDVIVTGGAICSMLLGENVNDFDVYFRTKSTTKLVAQYYVKKFNEAKTIAGAVTYTPTVREELIRNTKGVDEERITIFLQSAGVAGEDQGDYAYFETLSQDDAAEWAETLGVKKGEDVPDYRVVFMSQNAITLSGKMQLVIRFYGEPEEIHDNYDFVHATCYWDHNNRSLELPADAMESMLCRSLIYKGSLYPVASIFRSKKFMERGWRITAGQQLKIMWQISELDLTNYEVLREQLTGVDAAYMHQLIESLKGIDPEKITSAYVCQIIERIFD